MIKGNKIKIHAFVLLPLFFLFFIGVCSAILDSETQTNVGVTNGLEITYPKFDSVKFGSQFNLTVHVYNISNGIEVTQANCTLSIQNSTGNTVLKETLTNTSNGFNRLLTFGNFTQLGTFGFNIYCSQQPQNLGGVADGIFIVTPTGNSGGSQIIFSIFMIIAFYSVVYVGYTKGNAPITILGGMALMALGVYLINNGIIIYRDWLTNYFAYITGGIGFFVTFVALVDFMNGE